MIGPTGIWTADEAKPENYPHSELLCFKLIFEVFTDRKKWVLDFGCGDGYYLRRFTEARHPWVMGFDGCAVNKPANFEIYQIDLTTRGLNCERRFPMSNGYVLSLEVGEHIPQEFEENFIDNLCRHCNSRMVISWAIPGQEGIGHVNCRTNAHVIEQFEERGFKFNAKLSLYLRADIETGVSYFKNTLMVFDKQ